MFTLTEAENHGIIRMWKKISVRVLYPRSGLVLNGTVNCTLKIKHKEVMNLKASKEKITLAMARKCLNPQDLAKIAGLPPQTVNGVIRGQNVRPATFGKVALALGCDPAELVHLDSKADKTGVI